MEITDLNEQELNRRASLQKLQELGIEPYPAAEFKVNATTDEIKAGFDPEKGNFNDISIAGRLMSRTEAMNTINLEAEIALLDSQNIVHGIRTRSDLDEAPSAYKNIDEVIAQESDLVKVVTKLHPVAVIKG